MSSGQKPLSQN